ncbi:transposase family protein [Shewanella sp. 3_MG-2023]|uniref:integrase catalytic domain-containing protein n=1 Tax=Shewanella sp. 3_MG-2023 TaxID=3062635 RepID=UPI0026E438E1|nr:transposase family protein [Shewanella sp. 3_MG-2023]MDO6776235.1 transposase family protein [Shewanella sp. 3_MG-2023]
MIYSGYQDGSRVHTSDGLVTVQIINQNHCLLFDEDHNPILKTHEQIVDALKSGIYVIDIPVVPKAILTDYQINDRDTRLMYVKSLQKVVNEHNVRPTTSKAYKLMIEQVELDYPTTRAFEKHPAKSSICRYWKTWVKGRFQDNALACARRNAPTRINPASEAVLSEFVAKTWLDSYSKLRSAHYRAYCMRVNEVAKANKAVIAVSERSFYRRIGELNNIEDELLRSGIGSARRNQLLLTMQKAIRTDFVMQRVEMDRIDLNLCLIDDVTGEVTKKVSVYFAIDCYSRAIVGVVVDLGLAENKESVVKLFQQIYMQDENLPFCAKPSTVIMDNGPGFNNAAVQQLCEQLDIDAVYAPPNQPSKKPFVESFNNVFRQQFCSGLAIFVDDKLTVGIPGYAGVTKNKSEPNTITSLSKAAELSVRDFLFSLNTFLCEYSNKNHGTTKISPHEAWFKSLDAVPRSHYDYEAVLNKFHVLQEKEEQKLYSNGTVKLNKQIFFSYELKQLYIKTKSLSREAKVVVTLNPFDARYVTVHYFDDRNQDSYRIVAENNAIEDMSKPISFKALNGETEDSFDIYRDTKHTITGEYRVNIEKLYPQTTRRKRRGKETSSFEENNKQNISAQARIEQSNLIDSKSNEHLKANMRFNTSESDIGESFVDDLIKVDMTDKKRRW